jgi:hypothetical protein
VISLRSNSNHEFVNVRRYIQLEVLTQFLHEKWPAPEIRSKLCVEVRSSSEDEADLADISLEDLGGFWRVTVPEKLSPVRSFPPILSKSEKWAVTNNLQTEIQTIQSRSWNRAV